MGIPPTHGRWRWSVDQQVNFDMDECFEDEFQEGGGIIRGLNSSDFNTIMPGMDEDETDSGYATSANELMKVSLLCRVCT